MAHASAALCLQRAVLATRTTCCVPRLLRALRTLLRRECTYAIMVSNFVERLSESGGLRGASARGPIIDPGPSPATAQALAVRLL